MFWSLNRIDFNIRRGGLVREKVGQLSEHSTFTKYAK